MVTVSVTVLTDVDTVVLVLVLVLVDGASVVVVVVVGASVVVVVTGASAGGDSGTVWVPPGAGAPVAGLSTGAADGDGLRAEPDDHLVDRFTGVFGLVDLDADPTSVVGRVTGLRIFAGHSGWGAGQLEEEIEEGAWFVVPSEPGDVCTPDPGTLWSRVLRRQGGDLALLAHYPPDLLLN